MNKVIKLKKGRLTPEGQLTFSQLAETVEDYFNRTGDWPEVIQMPVKEYLYYTDIMLPDPNNMGRKAQFYRGIELKPVKDFKFD